MYGAWKENGVCGGGDIKTLRHSLMKGSRLKTQSLNMCKSMIAETLGLATVKALVEKTAIAGLKKIYEGFKDDYDMHLVPMTKHFEHYLKSAYERHSVVNTLVLRNRKCRLRDIYVPLTIKEENNIEEKTVIDGYPIELMKRHPKMIICDTAGMGKTTLMKRMFLSAIDDVLTIPVIVELRRIEKGNTLLDIVYGQIDSLAEAFDHQLLLKLVQQGGFAFFFDGYDEVTNEQKSVVAEEIKSLVSKAPNNTYIITSRPEIGLQTFGDFSVFNIQQLTEEEAAELLRKYDNNGEVSEILIKKLNNISYSSVKDFLRTPLLASLLFTAFDYKQKVPIRKDEFYQQVFDAYFESHDLTKDGGYVRQKKSGLNMSDFKKVLRYLGFKCLKNQFKTEFSKAELIRILDEIQNEYSGQRFVSENFIKDIITAVPLFVKDGIYYRWIHKSMQEYFAAMFIHEDARNSQKAILERMLQSQWMSRYVNLFDIYYDIDYEGFRDSVLDKIVTDYLQYFQDNFAEVPGISPQSVKERLEILYKSKAIFAFLPNDNMNMDDIWELVPEGRNLMFEYGSGVSMNIGGRRFVSDNSTTELRNLLFMLLGKKDPLCSFYNSKGGMGVYVGFPSSVLYKVESIYDCADFQLMYDSVNYLVTREGHIGAHINTDVAMVLKQEIEANRQRRKNANELLAGL